MIIRPLEGFTVGLTADGRQKEQATLFRRRGAVVRHGPVLEAVPTSADDDLRAATVELIDRPPDLLMVATATGWRMWLAAARRWRLDESLGDALSMVAVAARGVKAVDAMHASELSVWWKSPSETQAGLLEVMRPESLAGKLVAVVHVGDGGEQTVKVLVGAGAEVVELRPYLNALPSDVAPAARLVEAAGDGRLDAITFTSAAAVRNLFRIAEGEGTADVLRAAFDGAVMAACVGQVCAEAARDEGVADPVVPPRPRLGSLVQAVSERLREQRRRLAISGVPVAVQGALLAMGDDRVVLTARERAVLEALIRRPGVVVTRGALLREVWGSTTIDPQRVDATVFRLRQRMGTLGAAIQVIERRGYRLATEADPTE